MVRWLAPRRMASYPKFRGSPAVDASRGTRRHNLVPLDVSSGQSLTLGPRPEPRCDEQLLRIARALAKSFPELRNPLTWAVIKLVCKRLEINLRCVPLASSDSLMTFSGSWAIRINKDRSRPERLRLATRELAHFVLHRNHLVRVRLREIRACELKAWCDVEEDEATRFANILFGGVELHAW